MEKLTRGLRNNNPFNIKRSHIKFNGEISDALNSDPVFKQFSTRVLGIRAGLVILHTYMTVYNLRSVREIISRFAPSNENCTTKYIYFVSKGLGCDPDFRLTLSVQDLAALGYWICQFENGPSCSISLNDFIDCIKKYISL